MPSLQEIVEKIAARESDEIDEYELIDMLRTEFGFSEDEAQDLRDALEDRGFLKMRGTGQIELAITHNEQAEYDALEAAAEEIEPLSVRVGRRDPETSHGTYTLDTEGLGEELRGGTAGVSDLSGRTPAGGDEVSLEHLQDLELDGRVRDIDSQGEYVVANPAADFALDDAARTVGDEYYDDETLVAGDVREFSGEEVAP